VAAADRDAAQTTLGGSDLLEDVSDNWIYDAQAAPDDSQYGGQWHMTLIGAPAAWDITTGDENIVVAVVDTGVDVDHPDLAGKLLEGVNVFENSADTDDRVGHGTSTAGIIGAASDNREGIASLAWDCPILPIRVTNTTGRTTSWVVAAGIREAVRQGAKVINVSFAPLQTDTIVLRQARAAWLGGSLVVISAGNSGKKLAGVSFPSAIFVGATDRLDRLAAFSTRGDFVDLAAPGLSVITTKWGGVYGTASGTSFAAPVVSGVAALIWSVNPDFSPITVREILYDTAVDLGVGGWDEEFGRGRVDAAAALALAESTLEAMDEVAPEVAFISPADGATLQNTSKVKVNAYDDVELAGVVLKIDGTVLADDDAEPFEFVLIPSKFAAGSHELVVVATDTSGNTSEDAITVYLASGSDTSAPILTVSGPRDGSTVRGLVTILATASDDRGLDMAELWIDGALVETFNLGYETRFNLAYNWNTLDASVTAGSHEILLEVRDSSGNVTRRQVRVTVSK
jgi:hypothetical protein